MRRTATTAALIMAVAAGSAAASSLGSADGPRASARLTAVRLHECLRPERTAVFYARMRRVRGTRRMGIRFTLLERGDGPRFQALEVPALKRWRRSRSRRRAFAVRQRVRNLVEGRSYRMRVEFRWYGARRRLLRSTRRRSPVCRQFGLLPNLRARVEASRPTDTPGIRSYVVRVANRGGAPARDPSVRLEVDGAEVNTRDVATLAAGEARTVTFRGPTCESTVVATADPSNAIAESLETDNARTHACADLR